MPATCVLTAELDWFLKWEIRLGVRVEGEIFWFDETADVATQGGMQPNTYYVEMKDFDDIPEIVGWCPTFEDALTVAEHALGLPITRPVEATS